MIVFEDKNSKVKSMKAMEVVPVTSNLGRITAPIIFTIPLQLLSYHVALIKGTDVEISNSERKIKKYVPLSKRQDKPDSALWLIKQHNLLKDSQIAKLVGITKNSVTAIRNKSYWNYNNLNPKDPVALNLFTQKDLVAAIEKAERRIKREKKEKEKQNQIK